MNLNYRLKFYDYWHLSSGLSGGAKFNRSKLYKNLLGRCEFCIEEQKAKIAQCLVINLFQKTPYGYFA